MVLKMDNLSKLEELRKEKHKDESYSVETGENTKTGFKLST